MARLIARLLAGALIAICSSCVFYLNPQCDDLLRNGEESDVDCGGTCGPCSIGRSCDSSPDCTNGNCVSGRCAPLPCENGVLDTANGETDIDCGGSACRKCAGGRHCEVAGDCFNGQCVAGAKTCFELAEVSFADAVSYASGDKTYVLLAGDVDGDGIVDLLAANEQGNSITAFRGAGDGTFAVASVTNMPGDIYPTGGAIADVDRDGDPDVVTANYHGDSIAVMFGGGDGTFSAPTFYPTIADGETANLAVGDLDGDGNLDVVAANPNGASVSLFRGQPGGTFAPAVDTPVGLQGGSAPFSAAIADLDGDGDDDVAIAEMVRRTLVVRLGNGDGTLGPEVAYPVGGAPSYIVIARDIDLDGRLDLVSANRGSDDVSVLLGRGDGTFGDAVVSDTGAGTGPYAIAVADFNLDGVPDVVTPNYTGNNASVLLGIGNGSFEPPIDAGPTGRTTYGIAAGDFDRDGKIDIAACNAGSNDVTVKLSTSR